MKRVIPGVVVGLFLLAACDNGGAFGPGSQHTTAVTQPEAASTTQPVAITQPVTTTPMTPPPTTSVPCISDAEALAITQGPAGAGGYIVGASVHECVGPFALGAEWGTDGDGSSAAWYYDPASGWRDITFSAEPTTTPADVGAPDACNDIWQIDPTFNAYYCATPDGTQEHPFDVLTTTCDAVHDLAYGLYQGYLFKCSNGSDWAQA